MCQHIVGTFNTFNKQKREKKTVSPIKAEQPACA